ncbi:MAG TPA: YdeI/OmpD-associated family protein [Candidatus Nitrosopolaris sp.]|nr:YdeI/OmpD-associated family protein [Candidatus Nitrosopolaris sp.]
MVELTAGRDPSLAVVSISPDLKKALSHNARAEASFRKLAPSPRWPFIRWIEQAKKSKMIDGR